MDNRRFAVLDFETTGLSSLDRVIEIGVVILDDHYQETQRWSTLVQPQRDIDNSAVHQITATDLVAAPTFAQVAGQLWQLLNGTTVVAHNGSFEQRFLTNEYRRLGYTWPTKTSWLVDTMTLVKDIYPGQSASLESSLARLNMRNTHAHSALADAIATAELLGALAAKNPAALRNPDRLRLEPFDFPAAGQVVVRGGSTASASAASWLSTLTGALPQSNDAAVERYKQSLIAALSDHELSASELQELGQRAAQTGLGAHDIRSIHEVFIRQIAVEAWRDGVITEQERTTLSTLNQQLGLAEDFLDDLLATPQQGAGLPSLNLNPGDRVSFTGQFEVGRKEWERRARSVGLDIGGVAKKTVVLVASNPDSHSGKARLARSYNIPIVGEKTFAVLLGQVTPEQPESAQSPQWTELFPWLDALGGTPDASSTAANPEDFDSKTIAQLWLRHRAGEPLSQLSPLLRSLEQVELPRSTARSIAAWSRAFEQPLSASAQALRQLPGVGPTVLPTLLEAAVLSVLDLPPAAQSDDTAAAQDDTAAQPENTAAQPDNAAVSQQLDNYLDPYEPSAAPAQALPEFSPQAHGEHSEILLYLGWQQLAGATIVALPDAVATTYPTLAAQLGTADPVAAVLDLAFTQLFALSDGDPRKTDIIAQRWLGNATLEEIGAGHQVTRERIRQLDSELQRQRQASVQPVDQVIALIDAAISPAIRRSELLERFPALAQPIPHGSSTYIEALEQLSPRWHSQEQWLVDAEFPQRLREEAQRAADAYGVAPLAEVAQRMAVPAELLSDFIAHYPGLPLVQLDDQLLSAVSSYPDRAAAVLSIANKPLSTDELVAPFAGGNPRSASNQFSADPRIVRVSSQKWALAEWNIPEYSSITTWIGQEIDASSTSRRIPDPDQEGQDRDVPAVPLSALLSQAERLEVAESSIRAYASSGDFEIIDGWVVRRLGEQTTITGDISHGKDLYRHEGNWRMLLTVNSDHLRGSGFPIPKAIAAFYQLSPGQTLSLSSELGEQHVRVSPTKAVQCSTIRRFLEALNISEGQRVWLHFGEDNTFALTPAPALAGHRGGIEQVYDFMGLELGADTADAPVSALLEAVNEALGLEPSAPRRRTVAIFRHRGQDDMADLVRSL